MDLTGNTGAVTIGASGIKMAVIEWSASVDVDAVAIPAAFGEKWEGSALTVGRVTGSLRGKVQFDAASTKPMDLSGDDWSAFSGSATLTAATGCTLTGTMNYTNVQITLNRNGYGDISANFRNAGSDCAVTWDETSS